MIVGRAVANLLDGREPGFDVGPFRPERFALGGIAWNDPFTAGERPHQANGPVLAVPD